MLLALYLAGTMIAIILLIKHLFLSNEPLLVRWLLFSVAIVPLGKLIYFPLPGFVGLKVAFLVSMLVGIIGIFYGKISSSSLTPLYIMILPIASILWLEDPEWFFLHNFYPGQTDSVGLRLLVLASLICYFILVSEYIKRYPKLVYGIARAFVSGTLYASSVGVVIAVGIWNGLWSAEDIFPISVDTHVADTDGGGFYRFNPGANVNEFSMIIAFAIFLIRFAEYPRTTSSFLFCLLILFEFATLTRGSWIALLLAFFVGWLGSNRLIRNFIFMFLSSIIILGIFAALYSYNDSLRYLIDSRTTFEIGASGEERLVLFKNVFDRVFESPFKLLFGYGWATNMYVHNVYLQILYELGSLGFMAMLALCFNMFYRITLVDQGSKKESMFAIVVFISVAALTHHTFYHVQTWLMLGFVFGLLGITRKTRNRSLLAETGSNDKVFILDHRKMP
jgi:hypothetical protein